VSHIKMGDVLRDQGDLAGALAVYRESLVVSRRLAEADPSNARWQRNLSFVLTELSEFYDQHGPRTEALSLAEESRRIDERLAALDPSKTVCQSKSSASNMMRRLLCPIFALFRA
jgi:hypothetical protein